MEKLLNDQMLNSKSVDQIQQNMNQDDFETIIQTLESEIGDGNLQDYLEIYGETDDN